MTNKFKVVVLEEISDTPLNGVMGTLSPFQWGFKNTHIKMD